ncbi:MAG: hypothetical protein O3B65_04335 [Chloroflexi bacterium]|nr:hypothetical protein [Chloroflexota bacterium]
MQKPNKRRPLRLAYLLVLMTAALIASACSGGDSDEPTPTPTATPISAVVTPGGPGPTPTQAGSTAEPSPATPTPAPQFVLQVLSPKDGAGIEISAVRVFGMTRPDAIVAVNGIPADVAADGSFREDIGVTPGGNLIEVTSTNIAGAVETSQIAVFGVEPTAALPLSVFYPSDGITVTDAQITVIGGTRQDAVVGVNGTVASINRFGIFEVNVPLEIGANFIEIVAADLNDNVSFRTAVVFRSP